MMNAERAILSILIGFSTAIIGWVVGGLMVMVGDYIPLWPLPIAGVAFSVFLFLYDVWTERREE